MTRVVYIDSTLHHDWNLAFNPKLAAALEEKGITCHLPQRDTDQAQSPKAKFADNILAIKQADVLLAVASNESPNWGVEVGYAHGIGKKVVALTTINHQLPLMSDFMMDAVIRVESLEDIPAYLDQLVNELGEKE